VKYLLLIGFLSACGDKQALLLDGAYRVEVTYDVDRCACPSYQGTTDVQEWIFQDDTVTLFAGQESYDLIQTYNYLTVDVSDEVSTFHMDLYPRTKHQGFDGYWRSEIPGIMFTVAKVSGKREEL